MIDSPHETPIGDVAPMLIVSLPVVIFTKSDADAIAGMCPIKPLSGHNNVVAVTASSPPEGIASGFGIVRVIHHVKKLKTGKESIKGQWDVKVPVGRVIMDANDLSQHICRVQLAPPPAIEKGDILKFDPLAKLPVGLGAASVKPSGILGANGREA
jgi:hypothetical protein